MLITLSLLLKLLENQSKVGKIYFGSWFREFNPWSTGSTVFRPLARQKHHSRKRRRNYSSHGGQQTEKRGQVLGTTFKGRSLVMSFLKQSPLSIQLLTQQAKPNDKVGSSHQPTLLSSTTTKTEPSVHFGRTVHMQTIIQG